jgi:hypothetical protein
MRSKPLPPADIQTLVESFGFSRVGDLEVDGDVLYGYAGRARLYPLIGFNSEDDDTSELRASLESGVPFSVAKEIYPPRTRLGR